MFIKIIENIFSIKYHLMISTLLREFINDAFHSTIDTLMKCNENGIPKTTILLFIHDFFKTYSDQ